MPLTHLPARPAKSLRSLPRLFPWIFIGVAASLTAWGLLQVSRVEAGALQTSQPLSAEELRNGFDALKSRIDEMKWTLTIIMTVAGLFSVAQAAAAYFSSQTFTKQAEDALKKIGDIQKDMESKFPMFSDYERLRNEAYRQLAYTLREISSVNQDEGYDWRENLFESMELQKRQELLSVERFIGIEFLHRPVEDVEYTNNLRRLAQFYIAKFEYEQDRKFGYLGDIERAHYLLDLALNRNPDAFYLLNDLGLLYSHWYSKVDEPNQKKHLDEGRNYFFRSRNIRPQQQRVYYNLGVIERKQKPVNWRAAIKIMEQAAKEAVWEEVCVEARKADIHYNLACWWARVAIEEGKLDVQSEPISSCLAALGVCASTGLVREKTVLADYDKADGEFNSLLQRGGEDLRNNLKAIRTKLYTPPIKPPTRTNPDRPLKQIWDLIRKALS
jgi:tetratricopeptide (TPR) repeat protein